MTYEKLNFVNGSPPELNATTLNHIETGISEASEAINNLEADMKNKVNEEDVYLVEEAEDHFLSADEPNGSVDTRHIKNRAVTEEKLNPELLEKINSKIDDSEGVIQTEHIADKAITKNKIQTGAVTSIHLAYDSVLEKAIAIGQVKERHIEDGNITKAKLSDEVVQLIDSKYDASNVETGTGVLSTSETHADKINSATFEYQKVGDWVNLHIYIDFKAFSPVSGESITLSGLPYICKNSVNPRELCVTTQKKQMLWAIGRNSSSLTLLFFDTSAIVENEMLSFSLRYKIV